LDAFESGKKGEIVMKKKWHFIFIAALLFGICLGKIAAVMVSYAGENEIEHITAVRKGIDGSQVTWSCTVGNVELEITPSTIKFTNRQALNVWVHTFLKTGEKEDAWALIAKFHLGNPTGKVRIGSVGNQQQFVQLDKVLGLRKLAAGDILWVQVETFEQTTQRFLKRILPQEPRTKRERPTDATATSFLGNALVTLP
jgi:hypothetical protein